MARGRPKKNSSVTNVETPEVVLKSVEQPEICLENTESPEIAAESVEIQNDVQLNVEQDQLLQDTATVDETPSSSPSPPTKPKVLNKKPSMEDIVRWRRLGRR